MSKLSEILAEVDARLCEYRRSNGYLFDWAEKPNRGRMSVLQGGDQAPFVNYWVGPARFEVNHGWQHVEHELFIEVGVPNERYFNNFVDAFDYLSASIYTCLLRATTDPHYSNGATSFNLGEIVKNMTIRRAQPMVDDDYLMCLLSFDINYKVSVTEI